MCVGGDQQVMIQPSWATTISRRVVLTFAGFPNTHFIIQLRENKKCPAQWASRHVLSDSHRVGCLYPSNPNQHKVNPSDYLKNYDSAWNTVIHTHTHTHTSTHMHTHSYTHTYSHMHTFTHATHSVEYLYYIGNPWDKDSLVPRPLPAFQHCMRKVGGPES